MQNSLIVTGFLLAVFDEKDSHHSDCSEIFGREIVTAILPDVVIPEMAYLILRELNIKLSSNF